MSKWVDFRNKAEAFLGRVFDVAEPQIEHAGATALAAVVQAAAGGTAHNSHDMAMVALGSLKDQAPALGASLTLALASHAVHEAGLAAPADQSATPPPPV